jgi:hypothetical protein
MDLGFENPREFEAILETALGIYQGTAYCGFNILMKIASGENSSVQSL